MHLSASGPNGDGLSNIVAYAMGADCPRTDPLMRPRCSQSGGHLMLDYRVATDREGFTMVPEVSSDLRQWHELSAPAGCAINELQSGDGVRVLRARALVVLGEPRYLRLRVREQP